MVSRQFLAILVYSLPVLVVAFAVLMGAQALARATQDTTGATILWWIAMGCLITLVVDVLLLVGALGVDALSERNDRSSRDEG